MPLAVTDLHSDRSEGCLTSYLFHDRIFCLTSSPLYVTYLRVRTILLAQYVVNNKLAHVMHNPTIL